MKPTATLPPNHSISRDARIACLVQDLLENLAANLPIPEHAVPMTGPREVVLDTHFGGVRYVLLRVLPPSHEDSIDLSPREQEVARMVAKGYVNKTIAATLDISLWTVGTYLRRIFSKMRVNSRAQMVTKLSEMGLLRE